MARKRGTVPGFPPDLGGAAGLNRKSSPTDKVCGRGPLPSPKGGIARAAAPAPLGQGEMKSDPQPRQAQRPTTASAAGPPRPSGSRQTACPAAAEFDGLVHSRARPKSSAVRIRKFKAEAPALAQEREKLDPFSQSPHDHFPAGAISEQLRRSCAAGNRNADKTPRPPRRSPRRSGAGS